MCVCVNDVVGRRVEPSVCVCVYICGQSEGGALCVCVCVDDVVRLRVEPCVCVGDVVRLRVEPCVCVWMMWSD